MEGKKYFMLVKFKSELIEDEVLQIAEERAPEFRKLPGLIQKYYLKDNQTEEYAGLYLWDSLGSINEYKQSKLAQGMLQAYKMKGKPRIEIFEAVFELRSK